MGNCLKRHEDSSSMNWGGEDWDSLANDDHRDHHHNRAMETKTKMKKNRVEVHEEEKGLLLEGECGKPGSYESTSTTTKVGGGEKGATEVKIKMTKKKLEELMGRVELKQITVQQVLAQLILSVGDRYESTDHQRPWKPALQSIPEVN